VHYENVDLLLKWTARLSDGALKKPMLVKMEVDRRGTRDEHNYKLVINTEFDYSGEPMKLLTKSVSIIRSRASAGAGANLDKFEVQFKTAHPER